MQLAGSEDILRDESNKKMLYMHLLSRCCWELLLYSQTGSVPSTFCKEADSNLTDLLLSSTRVREGKRT
jgi:hypothetical protein